jgi:NAD(P)-dependent dehydrogenase (short-subunit alcohol dehydrogenase family)
MHRFDLSGKVALVTGGNGGIGQGIASGLLEGGAAVVIAGRNEQKNKDAVSELAKIGPPVSAVVLDVNERRAVPTGREGGGPPAWAARRSGEQRGHRCARRSRIARRHAAFDLA